VQAPNFLSVTTSSRYVYLRSYIFQNDNKSNSAAAPLEDEAVLGYTTNLLERVFKELKKA